MSFWIYLYDGDPAKEENEVFVSNMTINLSQMWWGAGIHDEIRKSSGKKAKDVDEALTNGLRRMRADPEIYRKMSSPNGWGTYEQALKFLEELVRAVQCYPDATIMVSG